MNPQYLTIGIVFITATGLFIALTKFFSKLKRKF